MPPLARSLLLLSAWPLASGLELLMASTSIAPPALGWGAASFAIALGLGAAQGILARRWRLAAWPGWAAALWLTWAAASSGLFLTWALPLVVPALLVATTLLARIRTREASAPRSWAAPALALLAVLGGRFLVLAGAAHAEPLRQFQVELTRPLRAAAAPEPGQGPPLLLLTVDTLRWDHATELESWQRLAARGRSWPRAMSTASWTVPAVASMHTGLPPALHGAGSRGQDSGFTALHEDVPTLAEQLAGAGYRTQAVVVNPFISRPLGFDQGFHGWLSADEDHPWPLFGVGRRGPGRRDGSRAIDHGLAFLDAMPDRGWFLWVHLFDPHLPYTHADRGGLAAQVNHPKQIRKGELQVTAELRQAVRQAYADEVAYVDAQLGRLLDALDARGFWQAGGTLVFTSDHGEELWDHGGFEHGHSHHGEVVDVPLVVVGPGVPAGVPGSGVASLRDVAPTLRSAAGLEPEGQDLAADVQPDRIATASGNLYGKDQHSARSVERRVILSPGDPDWRVQRYELQRDPKEQRALRALPDDPVEAAARAAQQAAESGVQGRAATVNEEALRALGYLE